MTVLVKPASGHCQLRCKYCFYCDETALRAEGNRKIMSDETADCLIGRLLESDDRALHIAFQGGEPTLAGLDFFRRFTSVLEARCDRRKTISYSIQTNGVLERPDEWAQFFAEKDFLVGLSFDGMRELHDLNRPDAAGNPTAARVLRTAQSLERAGVRFNILTVLTDAAARHIEKIYRFCRRQGWNYMQFIPCLAPLEEASPASLSCERRLAADKRLFDLWYADNIASLKKSGELCVSVRHLDDYLRLAAGLPPTSCSAAGQCQIGNVVESDGRVYPCDFYALDEYELGSIRSDSFAALAATDRAREFAKSTLPPDCAQCRWYPLCRGGCRRLKKDGRYLYCAQTAAFLEYAAPRLAELAGYVLHP